MRGFTHLVASGLVLSASAVPRGDPVPLPQGSPCPSTPTWPALAFGVFGFTSGGRGHVHQSCCGAAGVTIATEPFAGAPRNEAQVQVIPTRGMTYNRPMGWKGWIALEEAGLSPMCLNQYSHVFTFSGVKWEKGAQHPLQANETKLGRKCQLQVCKGCNPGWKVGPSLLDVS